MEIIPSDISMHTMYSIYKFYVRNLMTAMVPFFLLAYFNARIVATLKRLAIHMRRERRASRNGADKRKVRIFSAKKLINLSRKLQTNIKAATTTFLFIVSTYLASNVVNVVVTAWEFIDPESLFKRCEFYMITTDVVSLLTVR